MAPTVVLLSTDLVKKFSDVTLKVPKSQDYLKNIFRLGYTGGLAIVEGDIWKRKRKILSGLFNFTFLSSLTEKILTYTEQ